MLHKLFKKKKKKKKKCSDVSASPEMATKEAELSGEQPGSYRG